MEWMGRLENAANVDNERLNQFRRYCSGTGTGSAEIQLNTQAIEAAQA
jgi:hypothetical protein